MEPVGVIVLIFTLAIVAGALVEAAKEKKAEPKKAEPQPEKPYVPPTEEQKIKYQCWKRKITREQYDQYIVDYNNHTLTDEQYQQLSPWGQELYDRAHSVDLRRNHRLRGPHGAD